IAFEHLLRLGGAGSPAVHENCVFELCGSLRSDSRFEYLGVDTGFGRDLNVLQAKEGISGLLRSTDILILDLGGVGTIDPALSETVVRESFGAAGLLSDAKKTIDTTWLDQIST